MDNTRYKIVLVDDSISTLSQGKRMLQAYYKVYTVQSAATLFSNLEHDIPDLILLDVEMPDMDGFEALAKLKADTRYQDIPVMFLTAKSDEESESKGFSLGAADYITKPFSGPLLRKRISNQILYQNVQNAVKQYSDNTEIIVDKITKSKSRFLANSSNEIRTHMDVIVDITERLLEDDSLPDNVRESLEKISKAGDALISLINDALDISKIETCELTY